MASTADPPTDVPVSDGRLVPGRLGRLGRTLTTEPPDEADAIHVADLLDGDRLDDLLEVHAEALGVAETTVVASSWTSWLSSVVCPGILAAWTVHDVGVDASPRNLALHLADGTPRRCRIVDPGRVDCGRSVRDRTLDTLFGETLSPLFSTVERRAGLDAGLSFHHVGNLVAWLYDHLAETDVNDTARPPDRAELLGPDKPWGAGSNPMHGAVTYEPVPGSDLPETYPVRRRCCLKLQIPGKGPCVTCPVLSGDERADRIRARRQEG